MGYEQWFDVLRLIVDLKQGRRECRIPIVDANGQRVGRLEPISLRHLGDDELVRRFVRWRNQNLAGYLDQRPTTEAETAEWLIDVVTNPTRIAFLAYAGETLVARCGNVQMRPWQMMSDGLVRGEQGGGMRFIHHSQIAGIIWSFRWLRFETMHSKVLSTNDMALESCRSLGYDMRPYKSNPIYRKNLPTGVVIEEFGEPSERIPDVTLQYFQLKPESFFRVVEQTPGFAALDAEIRAAASLP
jgi:hypothetical protein